MSTLRIEGGRRLSGRVAVEGNKNSALPLLAACLLTEQECVLTNVPRIRDVEVMLRAAWSASARRSKGAGTSTLRVTCPTRHERRPDPALVGRLRGSVLLLGPLLARAAARLAPARRRFSGAPHDLARTSRRSTAMGAVSVDEPGHALEAPDGLTGASFYLDEASVTGTETALLAAAAADGRDRDPPRRDGAARRRAVRVPARDGRRRSKARARRRSASRRRRASAAPSIGCDGDYIEAGSWGVVAAITGGEIEVHGRAHRRHRSRRRAAQARWASTARYDDDRLRRRAVDADRRAAASRPGCGRVSRATWSASSPCSRRRPTGGRSCTTGCTSCGCSRSSS